MAGVVGSFRSWESPSFVLHCVANWLISKHINALFQTSLYHTNNKFEAYYRWEGIGHMRSCAHRAEDALACRSNPVVPIHILVQEFSSPFNWRNILLGKRTITIKHTPIGARSKGQASVRPCPEPCLTGGCGADSGAAGWCSCQNQVNR